MSTKSGFNKATTAARGALLKLDAFEIDEPHDRRVDSTFEAVVALRETKALRVMSADTTVTCQTVRKERVRCGVRLRLDNDVNVGRVERMNFEPEASSVLDDVLSTLSSGIDDVDEWLKDGLWEAIRDHFELNAGDPETTCGDALRQAVAEAV